MAHASAWKENTGGAHTSLSVNQNDYEFISRQTQDRKNGSDKSHYWLVTALPPGYRAVGHDLDR
jgi:hypothetical protein